MKKLAVQFYGPLKHAVVVAPQHKRQKVSLLADRPLELAQPVK